MATMAVTANMTSEQVNRWDQAIKLRKSVRTYAGLELGQAEAVALADFRPELLGGARVRHVLVLGAEAAANIYTGSVGGYSIMVGVPATLVFVAALEDPGHMAGIGYMGEQVILEATSLGLATCWITGSYRRESTRAYVELAPGEEIIGVSPVGLPAGGGVIRHFLEQSMLTLIGSGRRKPLIDIVQGRFDEPWLGAALEAARRAPSARNVQPWRFVVKDGRVAIRCESSGRRGPGGEDSAALDCGIAMAHFAVAARARGMEGSWELSSGGDYLATFQRREA